MRRFFDLFAAAQKLPLKDKKMYISAQLEQMLAMSALKVWDWEELAPNAGRRTLIGIATWSPYDFKLLDTLNDSLIGRPGDNDRIKVFDLDTVAHATGGYDYLEKTFPGIGKIFQTPVVGIWEDGTLIQTGSGAAGRELIIRRYGLNPEHMKLRQ